MEERKTGCAKQHDRPENQPRKWRQATDTRRSQWWMYHDGDQEAAERHNHRSNEADRRFYLLMNKSEHFVSVRQMPAHMAAMAHRSIEPASGCRSGMKNDGSFRRFLLSHLDPDVLRAGGYTCD